MPNLAATIKSAMVRIKGPSGVMCRLTGDSGYFFKPGELEHISDLLEAKGFSNLEYLGNGSNAVVLSVHDNPNIVIRIQEFANAIRFKIPYMLQAIGSPLHVCGVMENGRLLGGYELEFLKRLDMNVPQDALRAYIKDVQKLGYKVDSMVRNSEVGYYQYKNAATRGERRVLMAADPSALSRGTAKGLPIMSGHPSIKEQLLENLRLAREDSRLGSLIPEIEKQMETAPVCRKAGGVALAP